MVPPAPMLATKNPLGRIAIFFLTLTLLLAGCTPPGPRALLEGRSLLQQGHVEQALLQLKTATALMATNAQAWNYLGLAYHQAGQPTRAAAAYQKALTLNRDLAEVRYNRGCLWLEQNKLEAAKEDFTTFTMRRPNNANGWLKLGTVQLLSRQVGTAENDFQQSLRLSPQNPEALNGLGLAQLQRRQPREAAQYFAAALKQQSDFRPALLNLAIVLQQYLNNPEAAVQQYRNYLALKPPPPDSTAVRAIVAQLEQQISNRTRPAPTSPQTSAPPAAPPARNAATQAVASTQSPAEPKTEPKLEPKVESKPEPKPERVPVPTEVVKLPPEPVIKTSTDQNSSPPPIAQVETKAVATPALEVEPPTQPAKRTLLQKLNPVSWFRRDSRSPPAPTPLAQSEVLAKSDEKAAPETRSLVSNPASSAPPPVSDVGPYKYLSPAKPAEGNHQQAERAFAKGEQARQAQQWVEAITFYQAAVKSDPAYFEAYYNLGLTAFRLRNYSLALASWEYALAIEPDSSDARYNFALTLKAANHPADAARQLEKLLSAHPDEARAHLVLGNLYAEQLRNPTKARAHYQKVLELDPQNPQAAAVRYWLVSNPP